MVEGVNEARARIAAGEGQETEFKRQFPETARELAEVFASFATCNEGHVYLGVENSGEIVGLVRDDKLTEAAWRDAVQRRIRGIEQQVDPPILVEVSFLDIDGKIVCEIFVPKGFEPVYCVGNIPYLRDLDETRQATPAEVKAFHQTFFQAQGPSGRKSGVGLSDLLSQLSDLELLLSDVDQRVGDDLRQWRYDLDATAQSLRNLSSAEGVVAIGADREALSLANALEDLVSYRLYIDGGVSWKAFLQLGRKVGEDASVLAARTEKNIVFDLPEVNGIKRILLQQVQLIEDTWGHREDYLRRSRTAAMRAQLRQSAFVFSRLSRLLRISGEMDISTPADRIGESLRSLDSDKVFRPGMGRNPMGLMAGTFENILADARRIREITSVTQ